MKNLTGLSHQLKNLPGIILIHEKGHGIFMKKAMPWHGPTPWYKASCRIL
jgi:hypothetical protein